MTYIYKPYPKIYVGQRLNWRGEVSCYSSKNVAKRELDCSIWEPIATIEHDECISPCFSVLLYGKLLDIYVTIIFSYYINNLL